MQIKEADTSEHLNEASSPLLAILSPLKKADRDKKKKRRKRKGVDDNFELDRPYRPPTPDTHPIYKETKLNKAEVKQQGFPWDLRAPWSSYWIYVSATSEDMLSELQLFFHVVVPELQKECNKRRVRVIPIYLQDGLSAVEVHKCTIQIRLREIERSHCVLFLQGRMYGDVPSTDAIDAAGKEFPWLHTYHEGRSFQEMEVVSVFPELQLTKDSTVEDRKKFRQAAAEQYKRDMEDVESVKKYILVAQRGFDFMSAVPDHMYDVFKDPVYRRDVLQRALRTRVNKVAQVAQVGGSVDIFPDYMVEFKQANADGTYEIGALEELSDFLLRNMRAHIRKTFPSKGFGKWLRRNYDIETADQAVWALRARETSTAHSREVEIDRMTKYCDGQNSITPLLILGGTGAGKTSLMLKFMMHYVDFKDPSCSDVLLSKGWRRRAQMVFLSHFTCASSSARNPVRMLKRFCTKVAEHYYFDKPQDVPSDYKGLCQKFCSYSHRVGESFRGDMLMVMVDSIDELDMWTIHSESYIPKEDVSAVDWIPEKLPTMPLFPVRMILALDPDAAPETVMRLRKQQKAYQVNEIFLQSMDPHLRSDALRKMLENHGRDPFSLEKVISKLSKSETCVPIFMHYAVQELVIGNPSPTEMEEVSLRLPTDVTELCYQSILRVERAVDGGMGYVREILMLLSCTRRGLLESELWQLIKMQSAAVRRRPKYYRFIAALQGLKSYFRIAPLWSDRGGEHCYHLCHGLFARIVLARLMKTMQQEQAMHHKLADLFYQVFLALNLERLSNGVDRWLHSRIVIDEQARGLGEVVFHACKAHMFKEVRELLCSLRFVELRIMFNQLAELVEDYANAVHLFNRYPDQEGMQQIQDFYNFIKINSFDLTQRPSNTFQLAANAPIQTAPAIVSRAMLACNTESRVWLELRNKKQEQALSSNFNCKAPIIDLSITPDSRFIGVVADDGGKTQLIYIFDTFLDIKVATLSDFQHYTTCTAFFASGNLLATGSKQGVISFWDIVGQQRDGHMNAHHYPKVRKMK